MTRSDLISMTSNDYNARLEIRLQDNDKIDLVIGVTELVLKCEIIRNNS